MSNKNDKNESPSFIDNLFNLADAALTPLEQVLSRDTAPQKQTPRPQEHNIIDAEFEDVKEDDQTSRRHKEWEGTWKEPLWGCVDDQAWHAFPEASLRAFCTQTFRSDQVKNRTPLEHGKHISACTSCIIAVTKP